MASNASRGAAAKGRTKKFLIARGYQVADLEVVRWLFTPSGRIPVKKDQMASDLLAVSATKILFVQVKSGDPKGWGTFPAARRKFQEFVFPEFVQRVIIAWAPRSRAPHIVNVTPQDPTAKAQTIPSRVVTSREPVLAERGIQSAANQRTPPHGKKEESRQEEATTRQAQRTKARTDPREIESAITGTPRYGTSPRSAPR